jgi:ABC-type uncharacterized transport system fused permease/ATPase subunit
VTVLSEKMMAKNNFYALKNIDGRVDDMDARISDDISKFTETVSTIWSRLVWPLFRVLYFARRFANTVDPKYSRMIWGYFAVAIVVIKLIMPNYKQVTADLQDLEGKYKFVHSRVRTHSESIAFFDGGDRERTVVKARFDKVDAGLKRKAVLDFRFGICKGLIVHSIPDWIAIAIRFAHAADQFTDEQLLAPGAAGELSTQLHTIWHTNQIMIGAIQELLDFSDELATMSGFVVRIAEFNEVLDDLLTRDGPAARAESESGGGGGGGGGGAIGFDDVALVTPGAECLAKHLSVAIEPGKSLMVTGPNAAGKTSFFRVLGGLWPVQGGRVYGPRSEVFLVPQRVYSSMGSLADQITYPAKIAPADRTPAMEAEMSRLLRLVGIEFLVERENGWDTELVWEDTLSLGEQQRLGMARMYWNKPTFCVLDECTSAVSVDVEMRLYAEARKMGITSVTLSQRLALAEFHTRELRLGDGSAQGWHIKELPAKKVKSTGLAQNSHVGPAV